MTTRLLSAASLAFTSRDTLSGWKASTVSFFTSALAEDLPRFFLFSSSSSWLSCSRTSSSASSSACSAFWSSIHFLASSGSPRTAASTRGSPASE